MGKPRAKFYVVWHGRRLGVYATWAECERQVSGFSGARYQAFESRAQAEAALHHGGATDAKIGAPWPPPGLTLPSYSVDAACSGSPGPLEYRCVDNRTRQQVFLRGPYARGTNNVGEFLAIVQALQLVQAEGSRAAIYSDSQVALGWVRAKTCRTALTPSAANAPLFAEIRAAEGWLAAQARHAPLLKWDTALWGENPADFGRK